MLSILIAGFLGGAIRGLVGFIKHQFSYKNVEFNLPYFLAMMFLSGVIGALVTLAVKEIGFTLLGSFTPALALIVGYAGGDLLKIFTKLLLKNLRSILCPRK